MVPVPQAAAGEDVEQFREANRMRRRLVEQRTDHKNQLHAQLRRYFPGYHRLIGKRLAKRLLVLLSHYPSPQAILNVATQDLAGIKTGNAHRVGLPFAEKIRQLAALAPQQSLSAVTELLIRTTVTQILQLDDTLSQVDSAIERMLGELFPNQPLSSIPGLGTVSVAAILAELADVVRFPDKRRFIGYTGLYPIVWESGETRQRFRMTFKGNRMLKTTFLVASAAARQYNPVIASYYERLRARGKSTKAAGGAIARKLAEIAFTLLVRGEKWSREKATAGLLKAHSMSTAARP
jgi:transposase